ncbi:hypothetical protein B0H13DRAFT_1919905 [Mycena leptocephala]|nr:hypothetical protein B0H13DRAFT_1919905 [Mycena leptocephala]
MTGKIRVNCANTETKRVREERSKWKSYGCVQIGVYWAWGRQIKRGGGNGRDEKRGCWPFIHATVIRPHERITAPLREMCCESTWVWPAEESSQMERLQDRRGKIDGDRATWGNCTADKLEMNGDGCSGPPETYERTWDKWEKRKHVQ